MPTPIVKTMVNRYPSLASCYQPTEPGSATVYNQDGTTTDVSWTVDDYVMTDVYGRIFVLPSGIATAAFVELSEVPSLPGLPG